MRITGFMATIIIGLAVIGAGCVEDEPCSMTFSDCWYCGGLGSSMYLCTDMKTRHVCESVMINEPCHSGSTCNEYDEVCDDICLRGRCGAEGLPFSGRGGLAVGYTLEAYSALAQPVVMTTGDYGATWDNWQRLAPPAGCTGQRFEQLHFYDGDHGWIRAVGVGPDCDAGLWVTDDGARTWSWIAFGRTGDGTPMGGGPIIAKGERLYSGGHPAGVSEDRGATWQALPLVVESDPGGDATPMALEHFAKPRTGTVLCASSNYPGGGSVYCAPFTGAPFERVFDSTLPILMLSDEQPAGDGMALVLGGSPVTVLESGSEGTLWLLADTDGEVLQGDGAARIVAPDDGNGGGAATEILVTLDGDIQGVVSLYAGWNGGWYVNDLTIWQRCPQGLLRWPVAGTHDTGRYFALGQCPSPGGEPTLWMGYASGVAAAVISPLTPEVHGEPAHWTGLVVGLRGEPVTAP